MVGLDCRCSPDVEYSVDQTTNKWKIFLVALLSCCVIIHIIYILILSSVPPISRDALIHHLAIPKMYLSNGGMYEIPSMHFSYFPMNLDLLYLLPLYFKNDIVPKYIHFFFALMTAVFIYKFLKNALNPVYGLIGALFFLTIPVIVKLSVTAYVDLGLIFFSWGCLYYFLRWYDTDFTLRYLIFAAIFCGLALGTKYNGLILIVIMAVLIPLGYSVKKNHESNVGHAWQSNKNSIKGIQWDVAFLMIALIIFSPWMIRNTIWKHNPVYPLFNKVFNSPTAVEKDFSQKEKPPDRNAFWMRRYVYHESFLQTLLIPIRAFFQGQDDNPKYFDGKLNPFLLLFSLMSFFSVRNSRLKLLREHQRFFSVFAVLFILFVFFQNDFRIRYMAPAIPALVVLSVFGIRNMLAMTSCGTGYVKSLGKATIIGLIVFAFVYNGKYIYDQFHYIRPFEFITKKIDRDAYITRYRKEYPVIAYANKTLPEDASVLCLSIGDRTYYIDRSVHLAEDFYKRKNGRFSKSILLSKLFRYGTTHIIIDKFIFLNWVNTLNQKEKSIFLDIFQNNTHLLYEQNDVMLLELSDRSEKRAIP